MPLIPSIPRYIDVSKKALFFLLHYKVASLPIYPDEIIQELKCSIKTYSYHARKLGCTVQDICDACGSIDGYSIYDETTKKYKIIYNDEILSLQRIRFTLMHEVAHIYLNHFIDFEQTKLCRGGLNEDDLDVLDKEANHFASKVLAPEIVLLHAGWKHPKIIRQQCAISTEASKYKAQKIIEMEKTRNFITGLEVKILRQFNKYIYQRVCPYCNHYFIIPGAKYCPICSSDKISWGNEKQMIYIGFQLDQNSKALICPRCSNEDTRTPGDFCLICGSNLINKCLGRWKEDNQYGPYFEEKGCGAPASGNARFCHLCGAETTFYHQKLLAPWEEEKKQKDSQLASAILPPSPPKLVPNNVLIPQKPQREWESGKF